MATTQQVEAVGAFVGKLLIGLAFERRLQFGIAELPVLGAFKDMSPSEYKYALAAMLRNSDVKAALALIEGLAPPAAPEKPVDATVHPQG